MIILLGTQVFNNSRYGKSKRPININNVACTGSESKLLNCNHFVFSDDDKRSLLSLTEVVGVKCGGGGDGISPTGSSDKGGISADANCSCDITLIAGVYLTLAVLIAASIGVVILQL